MGVPQLDVLGDVHCVVANLLEAEDGAVLVVPVGRGAAATWLCPFDLVRVCAAIQVTDADTPLSHGAPHADLDFAGNVVGRQRQLGLGDALILGDGLQRI